MINLKIETQDLHKDVEECYYPKQLFSGNITQEEYGRYLKIFHCLHLAIEQEFTKFNNQWEKYNFPYQNYYRLDLIQKDLENLGTNPNSYKLENFSISSFPKAIGFLYVLTGSTMGGMLLSSKVEQSDNLHHLKSINNYFLGFKENTHQMWGDFMSFLNLYVVQNPNNQNEIIDGAKSCFKLIIKELSDEK